MPSETGKLAYIDALRGFAILLVILLHSSYAVPPHSAWLSWLTARGELGVQLFYIVSALTLCMSWEARSRRESAPVRNFLLRRFFRIAPMFYLAIAFYVWLNGFAPRHWAPYGIHWYYVASTALFLHGWHPESINSVVPGGWSVAVEWSFYLCLPSLLMRLSSWRSRLLLLAISVACAYLARAAWIHFYSGLYPADQQYLAEGSAYYSFPAQLPVFAIGLLFYLALRNKQRLPKVVHAANILTATLLLFILLPLKIAGAVLANYLVASVLFALLALNLAHRPARTLCNPITQFLGKISFSLYLCHFAVLQILGNAGFQALFPHTDLGSFTYYCCICAIAAMVAYPCYRFVELKGIAAGKQAIAWLERRGTLTRGELGRRALDNSEAQY